MNVIAPMLPSGSRHLAVVILAVVSLFSCNVRAADCTAQPCPESLEYLSATLADGTVVKGVGYRWNSFQEEFQLGFPTSRLEINGRPPRPGQMTTGQFVQTFESVLVQLHRRGRRVDTVTLRMDSVDELWSDIRTAVRKAARAGKGRLLGKDEATTRAMRSTIWHSDLVKQTCEAARRHGSDCNPKVRIGTNEIAFQHGYGGDRERMLKDPDVGMLPGMYFVIYLADAPGGAYRHAPK